MANGGQHRAASRVGQGVAREKAMSQVGVRLTPWHFLLCLHGKRGRGGSVKSPTEMQMLAAGNGWRTLKGEGPNTSSSPIA